MLQQLKGLQHSNQPIKVGLVGAGAMGVGIAYQISITPGMELSWVADSNDESARSTALIAGERVISGTDTLVLLESHAVDVFVESTNSIWGAYRYCKAALESGAHVVLMNAEVDLAFGRHLKAKADKLGLVVTSDAGDQHGVIATMIEEISMWGFEIVQAGNIKGFHNRYATVESLLGEAAKRNLNPIQCCAYTDGTKLSIEMALLANAFGYVPGVRGMRGPKLERVEDVLKAFDFDEHSPTGEVDYILGAEPGGGVYVVGKAEHPVQTPYLTYYKLGDGPYYLFFRPYHLCHLETPRAIAKAFLSKQPILQPWAGRVADVYAFAKRDLTVGECIEHGIGDDLVYGEIEKASVGDPEDWVPVTLLDNPATVKLVNPIAKDAPLKWCDLEWSDDAMVNEFRSI